ncbi:hypothetical protein AVEN_215736-1 [Araneus ventricosus]|uniref:Uncharacterized protein n=1 Tax=Araneus ventricosus TaxID=182803 RepID=A0A4Y2FKB0_ARAVE|nr:hypothetical protein AVEN_215736-1 [Araneus ventricosus]
MPTLQDLQRRITDACANVTPAMLHRVQREVQEKVQKCIVADGEKFNIENKGKGKKSDNFRNNKAIHKPLENKQPNQPEKE